MTKKRKCHDFFFVEMSRINSSKICKAVYERNENAHWRPRKYRPCIVNKNIYRPGFSRTFGRNLPLRTLTELVQRFDEYKWQSPYMVIYQLGLNMDQHGLNCTRQTFCRNSPSWNFTFLHANTSHRRADIAFSYDLLIFSFLLCRERKKLF